MTDRIVLGVSRTHDVSAALFKGSQLLGIAEAERVLEIKHARGPDKLVPAIRELCAQTGVAIQDIDAVAIADTGRERLEESFENTIKQVHGDFPIAMLGTKSCMEHLPLGNIELNFRDDSQVYYCCHHASHALSALYQSGFSDCAILVVDGYGVCCGTMGYHYRQGSLQRLDNFKDKALLGWRYQLFGHFPKEIDSDKTDILDLAGKVMGLNAYGEPIAELVAYFENWFRQNYDNYRLCWDLSRSFFEDIIPGGLCKDNNTVEDPYFLNIVASMQEAYSRVLEGLARELLQATGAKKLIISGGCALNVLANSRLAVLCDDVFIQPNSGDSGLSLGAAAAVAAKLLGTQLHHPMISESARRNPYMGLGLQDCINIADQIPENLRKSWMPEESDEACLEIAKKIAARQIIGMVRGRCEIGPRALGNRSIFANAADPEMRRILNEKIKHREWWRPFAPVCRAIDVSEYFSYGSLSPYMLITALVKNEFKNALSSACHEDGTARLQVLPYREWHPLLWDILGSLKEITGVGVLINTSFNDGGMPLVNRVSTAIDMLLKTKMDGAWIEGWMISK